MEAETINQKTLEFIQRNKELSLINHDNGAFIVNQDGQIICDVQKRFFRTTDEYATTCAILCGVNTLAEIYLATENLKNNLL